jgi:hypothetical protein
VTLSKQQQEAKDRFQKFLWIHERDLLWLAQRHPAWRVKAHELNFRDEKIDAVWTFPDEGRLIKYTALPLS